jgi:hypothetical protein
MVANFALWIAHHVPLFITPLLPVPYAAHPEGVYLRPEVTAEQAADAVCLFLSSEGVEHDAAAVRPIVVERLAAER